jgi:hypothetical protein
MTKQRAIMGVVDTPQQAELGVRRLEAMGFAPAAISVLFPDKRGEHDFAFERSTKAPEGALAGVGFGAAVGGLAGISAGVGLVTVPGLGALVAAGPYIGALSGASAFGLVFGLVGALVGATIPEIVAKHYAGKVRTGSILVAVHVRNRDEARRAREVMRSVAATDVTATTEAAVPADARA